MLPHLFRPAAAAAFLATIAATAAAGERELKLPASPDRYVDPPLPAHFEERLVKTFDNTPSDNPTTDAGALLGRVLFYDTRLSANGTTSCGSCHQQKHAFTDPDRVSAGYKGKRGDRNAMSLVNLRYTRGYFFWDERGKTLEEAVLLPIHSGLEMGHEAETLVAAVGGDRRYEPLFEKAFGTKEVTRDRVAKALSQFIRSLVSADGKYDREAAKAKTLKEDFPGFTASENSGKALFVERCNRCHHIGEGDRVAFFGMFRSLNNGMNTGVTSRDGGLADVTFNPNEAGSFRSPDLRNVAVTAPYMHDGRFETLDRVLDHYATVKGIEPVSRFEFTAANRADLIAFLNTLTDDKFLTDTRFSDPWVGGDSKRSLSTPIPAFMLPKSATDSLSPAERVAKGVGLRVGESLPWLKTLDVNGDGKLDRTEAAAVAEVMVRTRVVALTPPKTPGGRAGAAGRTREPAEPPTGLTADGHKLGDFNRDGEVDEEEAKLFAGFKRLVENGDGGRLETIMDRFFARLTDEAPRLVEARKVVRDGKAELAKEVLAADRELIEKLQKLLGPERFLTFQDMIVGGMPGVGRRKDATAATAEKAIAQVFTFDTDADDRLDAAELAKLAEAMDSLPAGFGRSARRVTPLNDFRDRLLAHYDPDGKGRVSCALLPERMHRLTVEADADRDGSLTGDELTAYVRQAAFLRMTETGAYIGNGFNDLFVENAAVADAMDLPDDLRTSAKELLAAHKKRVAGLNAKKTEKLYPAFRAALYGKSGAQ